MLTLSQPITAINGFKIGDKVRLKDGDGRPHIIKAFAIDGLKEFFFVVKFEDETETMLNNISPFPSNLDEAAEEYAKEQLGYCDDNPDDENINWGPLYFAFKAGAEWQEREIRIYLADSLV